MNRWERRAMLFSVVALFVGVPLTILAVKIMRMALDVSTSLGMRTMAEVMIGFFTPLAFILGLIIRGITKGGSPDETLASMGPVTKRTYATAILESIDEHQHGENTARIVKVRGKE